PVPRPIPAGLSRWIFPLCASEVPVPAGMPPWLGQPRPRCATGRFSTRPSSPKGCRGRAGSWEHSGIKNQFFSFIHSQGDAGCPSRPCVRSGCHRRPLPACPAIPLLPSLSPDRYKRYKLP
uniref:Uncharacterized protein n=1 Tax=Cyanoderma ruficeps TaxID=181631 RepID=A0A8C3QMJ9_9PASS